MSLCQPSFPTLFSAQTILILDCTHRDVVRGKLPTFLPVIRHLLNIFFCHWQGIVDLIILSEMWTNAHYQEQDFKIGNRLATSHHSIDISTVVVIRCGVEFGFLECKRQPFIIVQFAGLPLSSSLSFGRHDYLWQSELEETHAMMKKHCELASPLFRFSPCSFARCASRDALLLVTVCSELFGADVGPSIASTHLVS